MYTALSQETEPDPAVALPQETKLNNPHASYLYVGVLTIVFCTVLCQVSFVLRVIVVMLSQFFSIKGIMS